MFVGVCVCVSWRLFFVSFSSQFEKKDVLSALLQPPTCPPFPTIDPSYPSVRVPFPVPFSYRFLCPALPPLSPFPVWCLLLAGRIHFPFTIPRFTTKHFMLACVCLLQFRIHKADMRVEGWVLGFWTHAHKML